MYYGIKSGVCKGGGEGKKVNTQKVWLEFSLNYTNLEKPKDQACGQDHQQGLNSIHTFWQLISSFGHGEAVEKEVEAILIAHATFAKMTSISMWSR